VNRASAPMLLAAVLLGTALSPQLALIEHRMPLMPPHQYEGVLREAMRERGDIVRWYIGRVDESGATAEVVLLTGDGSTCSEESTYSDESTSLPDDASAIAADAAAAPTSEEMQPGSAAMLSRAVAAQKRWAERVLTPLETFSWMADEDDIEVYDVRTTAQRREHMINERVGVTIMGAKSVALDDLVAGRVPLPASDASIVLACSKGPKSLVALDFLASTCTRAIAVEGGITAWDAAALPTENVT